MQDLLSQVLQPVMDRITSPTVMTRTRFSSLKKVARGKWCISSFPMPLKDRPWVYFSHSLVFRAGSPKPLPTGTALLCCSGKIHDPFSRVMQLVCPGPVLPGAAASEQQGQFCEALCQYFSGNRSLGYQCRWWLGHSHGSRQSPLEQSRTRQQYDFGEQPKLLRSIWPGRYSSLRR